MYCCSTFWRRWSIWHAIWAPTGFWRGSEKLPFLKNKNKLKERSKKRVWQKHDFVIACCNQNGRPDVIRNNVSHQESPTSNQKASVGRSNVWFVSLLMVLETLFWGWNFARPKIDQKFKICNPMGAKGARRVFCERVGGRGGSVEVLN